MNISFIPPEPNEYENPAVDTTAAANAISGILMGLEHRIKTIEDRLDTWPFQPPGVRHPCAPDDVKSIRADFAVTDEQMKKMPKFVEAMPMGSHFKAEIDNDGYLMIVGDLPCDSEPNILGSEYETHCEAHNKALAEDSIRKSIEKTKAEIREELQNTTPNYVRPDNAYVGAEIEALFSTEAISKGHRTRIEKIGNGHFHYRDQRGHLAADCLFEQSQFILVPLKPLTLEEARKICLNDKVRLLKDPKEEHQVYAVGFFSEELTICIHIIKDGCRQQYACHEIAKA